LSIGLEMFLTPHKIIPGGIKGLAILLSHVTEMKMGLVLLFINLPFVILKNRSFFKMLMALLSFLIITILVVFMHPFPPITADPLLAAVCGGITFGLGVGFVVRYGWYADGVNSVAFYLKKKVTLTISEILMIINLLILTCGGFLFGWDQAMYSVIAYLLAMKSIQFVIDYNRMQLICVTTDKYEQLDGLLRHEFNQDIQFLTPSEMNSTDRAEIYLLLPRKHIKQFKSIVSQFDSTANVVASYSHYSPTESMYRN
jgi:uncharacterized membrane-anchored protein YitT (DUF2179 family)